MSKSTTKKVAKKVTGTARKSAATAKGVAKKVTKAAAKSAAKPRSVPKAGAKKAAVSTSGRKVVKKTTKSAKTTKSPAKTKAAPAKKAAPARAGKAKSAKSTSGSTTRGAAKPTTKASKAAGKTTRPAARKGRRDIDDRIDVKTGSLAPKPGSFGFSSGSGTGVSFLSGKPGSSGSAEVESDVKRLTRTKLNVRELRHFRELLLQKRRQLLGDMDSMESEALRTEGTNLSHLPVHMADMGTDNYEQEFTLNLVDRDRKLIDEVDLALAKIDKKTYGICEGTGQMISKARLEAQPWARYSIEHARRLQQPGMRR